MRFALVSDLHVDFWGPLDWETIVKQPVDAVVVAGDVDNSVMLTELVLQHACESFPQVVFCDGNHEHYQGYPVTETMDRFRRLAEDTPNLTYLDGTTHCLVDDVAIVGTNGWYDFKMNPEWITPEQSRRHWLAENNDSKQINFDISVEQLAARQAAALAETISSLSADSASSVVVVTHTVPHPKGLQGTHDPGWNLSNGAFGNFDMSAIWTQDWQIPIRTWCYGHTHFSADFTGRGTRFLCNPRGYPFEISRKYEAVYVDTNEVNESAFGSIER